MKPSNLLWPAAKEKNMNARGQFAAVNGLKMYDAVHGTGPPVAGKRSEKPVDFAASGSTNP